MSKENKRRALMVRAAQRVGSVAIGLAATTAVAMAAVPPGVEEALTQAAVDVGVVIGGSLLVYVAIKVGRHIKAAL